MNFNSSVCPIVSDGRHALPVDSMSGDPYRARGRNRHCSRWARVKFVLGAHVSSRCAASITGIIAVVSLAVVLLSIAFITGEIGAVKMPPFPSAGPVRWSSSLISPEKEEGKMGTP